MPSVDAVYPFVAIDIVYSVTTSSTELVSFLGRPGGRVTTTRPALTAAHLSSVIRRGLPGRRIAPKLPACARQSSHDCFIASVYTW